MDGTSREDFPKAEYRELQTDPRVEEITDRAPVYEIGAQTDFFIDTPPIPLIMKVKTGTDTGSQVEDNEIFDFDIEVEPVLSALIGKCLEHSRMEVLEEEEIRKMRQEQARYDEIKANEERETQILLEQELKRLDDNKRRKEEKVRFKEGQVEIHKKLISRIISKDYLNNLRTKTLKKIKERGFFRSNFNHQIDSVLIPWIHSSILSELQISNRFNPSLDSVLKDLILFNLQDHSNSIKKEYKRREDKHQEEMRIQELKDQEKARRKAEKEARKLKEELKKLKENINENIITKGVSLEGIITQQTSNPNGYFSGKPFIGVCGDLLLQLGIVLTAAQDLDPENIVLEEKFLNQFLGVYLFQGMNVPKLNIFLNPTLVKLITSTGKKLEEINLVEPELQAAFTEQFLTYEHGDQSIYIVKKNPDEFRVSVEALDIMSKIILKLIFKKPELIKGKLQVVREKINIVTIPEDVDINKPLKAIVRIMIPRVPVEKEGEENNDKTGEKKKELTGENANEGEEEEEMDEEGEEEDENQEPIETVEIEYEDKILSIKNITEEYSVMVLHQVASREMRKDISNFMKQNFPEKMDKIEIEKLIENAEEIGRNVEAQFLEQHKHLPVFIFEIN